jgi:mannosyltransferase
MQPPQGPHVKSSVKADLSSEPQSGKPVTATKPRVRSWIQSAWFQAALPVVALTLLGLLLRRYHLGDESLWFDEADIVARARQPLDTLLGGFMQAGENGPLYTLMLHFWLRLTDAAPFLTRGLHLIFGPEVEAPVRALAMIFGVATIPAIYLFARRVGGHALGLISAGLLAVNPFHIWHSQDAKMYTLLVLAAVVSSLLYLWALERDDWRFWAGYVVATWVMLTAHSMALLVLLAQLAATPLIVRRLPREDVPRRSWVGWGWTMLLILGPIFPIAWLRGAALVTGTVDVGGWYAPAGLNDIVGTLAVNYAVNQADMLWQWVGAVSMALLAIGGLLYLYGRIRRTRPDDESAVRVNLAARPLLIAMLVIPLIGFWLVTLKLPLFQARYLIMALPTYLVLAGAGLLALWRLLPVGVLLAALPLAAASVFALGGVNYADEPRKEDWRSAMAYVMDHTRLRDTIIVFPGYLVTAADLYYAPGGAGRVPDVPIKTVPSLGTEGFGERELHRALFDSVKCHERAWLVTSPEREEREDPELSVRQWLQFNWRTFDTKRFNGVTVYGIAFNGQPDCWFPEPTSPQRARFTNGIEFLGYIYELRDNATVQPDASYLPLTLYWRSPDRPLTERYEVRVQVESAKGEGIVDESLPPHNGFWPTTEWPPGINIIDYRDVRLPGGLEPGPYTVTIQLHPPGKPEEPLALEDGGTEVRFNEPLQVVPWSPRP